MIVSVVIVIFSFHKLTRKQKSGLQRDGFCVIAAVLYQLSYEDPYIESRPTVEYILKFRNFFRVKLQLLNLPLPLRRPYLHLNFDTLLNFIKHFYSRVIFSKFNSLHKKTVLRNRVCSITTCSFVQNQNSIL